MPLLYDRDCGFCRFSVAVVLFWDRRRRMRPVAIQSDEGQPLLADLPEEARLATAHVVMPDGTVRSGGEVAAPVMRQLPGGRPFATLARRVPRLADRTYDWIAARRGSFGRLLPASTKRWADEKIASRI